MDRLQNMIGLSLDIQECLDQYNFVNCGIRSVDFYR